MFGLSSRTIYAIAAIFILAQKSEERPVPIKEIAAEAHIPRNFLEQILLELKKAGILASTKGAYGGYKLARSASEITLKEVVTTLEDGYFETICKSDHPALKLFWHEVYDKIAPQWEIPLDELLLCQQKAMQNFTYTI